MRVDWVMGNGFGIASIILGVLGIIFGVLGIILGPLAIIFALIGMKKDNNRIVCIIGLILGVVGLLWLKSKLFRLNLLIEYKL